MIKMKPTDLRAVVALNLRRLRRERGWTQATLSERVGMDRTYVSALENGANSATVDMLTKLAGALGVEPVALLDVRSAARSVR